MSVTGRATRALLVAVREERAPGEPVTIAATRVWHAAGGVPPEETLDLVDRSWREAARREDVRQAVWPSLARAFGLVGPPRDEALAFVTQLLAHVGFMSIAAAEAGRPN